MGDAKMIIRNALVYTANHQFEKKDIVIKDEKISDILSKEVASSISEEEMIDAEGLCAIPGLVDIHFHGAVGYDFCDASQEGIQAIADFEASKGVLAICPATMTYSEEILSCIMETAANYKNEKGADLVGINMEGPFISSKKIGAQNPEYVALPDVEMFCRLQEKSGKLIKLVDIAPETDGAIAFIDALHKDVNISLAHNAATYEEATEAFNHGARHMTHLYNAMPGINHREPGPIIAARENGAEVELICDGIHIHPAMVRFTFAMFGADKVILISDSMRACGLANGQYQLGGQDVTVADGKAVLTENPDTIAGSVTSLYDCMKKAVLEMDIPLEDAVRAATENPAKAIGIDKEYGKIDVGYWGNVVLMDKDMNPKHIIHRGKMIR